MQHMPCKISPTDLWFILLTPSISQFAEAELNQAERVKQQTNGV